MDITIESIKKIITNCVIESYKNNESVFDLIIDSLQELYESPSHNLKELKDKESKQVKGLYFEYLCLLYLKYIFKYSNSTFSNVWLLKDTPQDILEMLSLKKRDYGIDIICEYSLGVNKYYIPVQCKYRKKSKTKSKTIITWKMLSTFYALCLKTGPWQKYIVMTNADYITHMGPKTKNDISICIGSWQKITKEEWLSIGSNDLKEDDNKDDNRDDNKDSKNSDLLKEKDPTPEELRLLRLKFLGISN